LTPEYLVLVQGAAGDVKNPRELLGLQMSIDDRASRFCKDLEGSYADPDSQKRVLDPKKVKDLFGRIVAKHELQRAPVDKQNERIMQELRLELLQNVDGLNTLKRVHEVGLMAKSGQRN
jgi:hypothetical protein